MLLSMSRWVESPFLSPTTQSWTGTGLAYLFAVQLIYTEQCMCSNIISFFVVAESSKRPPIFAVLLAIMLTTNILFLKFLLCMMNLLSVRYEWLMWCNQYFNKNGGMSKLTSANSGAQWGNKFIPLSHFFIQKDMIQLV